MTRQEFIEATLPILKAELLEELKQTLIDKYISVSFLESSDITLTVFSEILNDYFEKVQISMDKSFDKIIDKYAADIDSVVNDKVDDISESEKSQKGESRERKYYSKARQIKKHGLTSIELLQDYSRIMLCLYAAIINNTEKATKRFDYSLDCLDLVGILEELEKEETSIIVGKKKAFNIKEAYRADRSTFVILIIMYYYIMNNKVEAE